MHAPAEYREILQSHLSDFDVHLNFDIDFIPLEGDQPLKIFENKSITVFSLPLRHRVPSFGFLFREKQKERKIIKEAINEYNIPLAEIHKIKKGSDFYTAAGKRIPNKDITLDPPKPRSFAYCSDTMYFKRLSEFVRGVDLLYHEATFASDNKDLAARTGHSTSEQAARVAYDADVGKLIIGHFSARYKDVGPLLDEAREIFPRTIAAEEGSVIPV